MEIRTFNVILGIVLVCKFNSKRTRIFGKEFVQNNKEKCKMIYKDIEKELKEYYQEFDNKDLIKFKLKFINNTINMSCMFKECENIESIKFEENNNEINIESNNNDSVNNCQNNSTLDINSSSLLSLSYKEP